MALNDDVDSGGGTRLGRLRVSSAQRRHLCFSPGFTPASGKFSRKRTRMSKDVAENLGRVFDEAHLEFAQS
jgi:hypothetical protein